MGVSDMNIEHQTNKAIITDYVMHILSYDDKAFASRSDLITNWTLRNQMFINIFKAKHGITSEREFKEWVNDAGQYICNIRQDVINRLKEKSFDELVQIMTNDSVIDNFIEKYKTKE
jgi:hypothetical protein